MCAEKSARKLVRLLPLPTIKDLMQMYKVRATRKLSQNFLLNETLNRKIVKSAGKIKNAEVCEVGPGPGNITRSIIHKGAERVILIEKDPQFLPTLQVRMIMNMKYEIFIILMPLISSLDVEGRLPSSIRNHRRRHSTIQFRKHIQRK